MNRVLIKQEQIRFKFVPYGTVAPDDLQGQNELYVDVGNGLRPGVVDQHQLHSFKGSTAQLLAEHTELLESAISEDFAEETQFLISMHEKPDFDCLLSTWVAIKLLSTGALPQNIEGLLMYSSEIDEGRLGATRENPFSIYSAYMFLSNRLGIRRWRSPDDCYQRQIYQGLEIIDYAYEQIIEHELSPLDVNTFYTPGLFSPLDENEMEADLQRYENKLNAPTSHAKTIQLRLSGVLGGRREVPALFVRHVQDSHDPHRVIHFKDWARSDLKRSGAEGFVVLSVYSGSVDTNNARCIISVKPSMRVYLKGLGKTLEDAESAKRIEQYGADNRLSLLDDKGEVLANRPGYNNPDPWYDGRGHSYTIVDSPRSGTVLSPDEIEAILLDYGQGESQSFKSLSALLEDPHLSRENRLNLLSQIALDGKNERSSTQQDAAKYKVFISYSRKDTDWAIQYIYEPLVKSLGEEAIFFDKASLKGGQAWVSELSNAIDQCELFIPIYSPNFFDSDFCQWELQQAFLRDPTGRKGVMLPFSAQEIEIPKWCSLVQNHVPSSEAEVLGLVQAKLGE
jgi:hypothetical protein